MEMIMAMPISITSTKSPKSQFLPTLCSFSSPKSLNFTTHHQFPLQTHPTFSQKSLTITSTPSSSGRSIIMQASASDSGENIGDLLGEVTIFTAAGEPVMMKDLWDQKEGIAVVALLRHFGCPCCWELASVLRESISTFQSAGVKLIAVGVGEPNKARILAERLPFPMDSLYADPERKLYDVLGLYYGVGRTLFNPASAKVFTRFSSFAQAVKNYTIKATPDDRSGVLQQGGMFVFKGKQLLYARKDEGTVKALKVRRTRTGRSHCFAQGGGGLGTQMNLFDRFARVVKSYANAILSSFEDPEKILDQTVLENE